MQTHRFLLFQVLVFIAGFFVCSLAWAVVGTVVVKDTDGNPVPNATITLTTPDGPTTEKTTGPDGSFTAEEGQYSVTIRYDSQQVTKSITVRPGGMTVVEVPSLTPGTAPPPVTPGSNVVFVGTVESLDDVTRSASSETTTARLVDPSGNVLVDESSSFTADQSLLDQRNAEIDHGVDINAWGAGATIGLGSFGGSGYAQMAPNTGSFGSRTLPILASGSGMGNHATFYPYVSGMIGRADVDVDFVSTMDPSMSQTFSGDGLMWGIGGGALFFYCSDCNWFSSADYRYDQISDIDMTVTPSLLTDGILAREEFKFGYDSHTIQGIVGYNTAHVAPYGGIRGTFRTMTLDGDILIDFSNQLPGFQATAGLMFAEEFEENTIEGVAGVDFRAGHFVAGFEGSFNSNNYRLQFHGGFGF